MSPDDFLYPSEAPVGFNHEPLARKLELILVAFYRLAELHEEKIIDLERTLEEVEAECSTPLTVVETSQEIECKSLLRQGFHFYEF